MVALAVQQVPITALAAHQEAAPVVTLAVVLVAAAATLVVLAAAALAVALLAAVVPVALVESRIPGITSLALQERQCLIAN